jgi:hypothetical protein
MTSARSTTKAITSTTIGTSFSHDSLMSGRNSRFGSGRSGSPALARPARGAAFCGSSSGPFGCSRAVATTATLSPSAGARAIEPKRCTAKPCSCNGRSRSFPPCSNNAIACDARVENCSRSSSESTHARIETGICCQRGLWKMIRFFPEHVRDAPTRRFLQERSPMMGKNELGATVDAEVVAPLHDRMADADIQEPSGGGAYWRSKARASTSAHGLQRLRRDRARARLVAQLMGDAPRAREDRIDDALAQSFPASDPPY